MRLSLAACLLFLTASVHAQARTTSDLADCHNVGARLNEMASTDQQIRHEWMALNENPNAPETDKKTLHQRWAAIDSGNLRQLKEIIAACGWPTEKRASHNAWLLTQHADSDTAFQKHARNLLEASVKAGIGAPRDLAYLADRIATAERRPQEYGTQFTQTDRCNLQLVPVDNVDLVNRRRLAVGLSTLEEYEAEARRRSIPADCSK